MRAYIHAYRLKLPPLPTDNYFNSADYIEEVTRDRLMPRGALTYEDLDFKCNKVSVGGRRTRRNKDFYLNVRVEERCTQETGSLGLNLGGKRFTYVA